MRLGSGVADLAMRFVLSGTLLAAGVANGAAQGGPRLSDDIKPPSEQQLVLRAHATGEQIYSCQAVAGSNSQFAWVLSGPDATLVDETGKQVAKHFAGPTWQSDDGSEVKGKVVSQTSPNPGAIPWLLLAAVDHSGTGVMSTVQSIQRINTQGGKAPAAGCDAQHAGAKSRVAYSADYYFYSSPK